MTSEFDYITSLISAQIYLYRIGGPILIGIGSLSCILSFIIFTKKNIRQNPCSIYFLAYSMTNFLIIYTSILLSTLAFGYNIMSTAYNLTLCHFYSYTLFLSDILNPFCWILASIDRILVTSKHALTRQRSTHHLAYKYLISGTIFWMLFFSHTIIFSNIIEVAPNSFVCYYTSEVYQRIMTYYILFGKAIFIPLVMTCLGLWAIKNIRSMRSGRVVPVLPSQTSVAIGNAMNATRSKDRQLIKILLINISVYIIFNMMLIVVLVYQEITRDQAKDLVQTELDALLGNVATFGYYIPFCIGGFSNLFVSKAFRKEIANLLLCK